MKGNSMYQVWQSVIVTNQEHARHQQAGTVFATNPAKPDEITLKFDTDGQTEAVKTADIKAL